MWLCLRRLTIIPDLSFVFCEIAKNRGQRLDTHSTPAGNYAAVGADSDLKDFRGLGHKLKYASKHDCDNGDDSD